MHFSTRSKGNDGQTASAIILSSPKPLGLKSKNLSEDIADKKFHGALPVISGEEYRSLYDSQSTPGKVATFDFQGYVEFEPGIVEYRDVLATNGLRGGIHVGIDGVISYDAFQPQGMQSPDEVGEYVIYITVPPEVQKAERVFCSCDSCHAVPSIGSDSSYGEDEVKFDQSNLGYIVVRLMVEPHEDPTARQQVNLLNLAITQYIEKGLPLDKLSEFIRGAESHIASQTPMVRSETLLEEGFDSLWERFMRR